MDTTKNPTPNHILKQQWMQLCFCFVLVCQSEYFNQHHLTVQWVCKVNGTAQFEKTWRHEIDCCFVLSLTWSSGPKVPIRQTLRAGILLMCSQGDFKYVVAMIGTSAAIISPLFVQIGHWGCYPVCTCTKGLSLSNQFCPACQFISAFTSLNGCCM